jgi:glycogen phosphorylase
MDLSEPAGVSLSDLLSLGRVIGKDGRPSFSLPYLAVRGSMTTFGVSRLHGQVSREIFQPLFPRWPRHEVPVGHVTNGVHVPSWDSPEADRIWTAACSKERWRQMPDELCEAIGPVSDEILWAMRAACRKRLVGNVRSRLKMHLSGRGVSPDAIAEVATVLDPNVLTLGFARRFTAYKRLDLLLDDPDRLGRLLTDGSRPMQLVLAGKAHPDDEEGKAIIQAWLAFAQRPEFRRHVVFLEDYDITLAEELVEGVDVWINTPRRPLEACGTSGMKILVNGGLNLSELDGWWEEAYAPDLGWAIGHDGTDSEQKQDERDSGELYRLLEGQIAREFYSRDDGGIPRTWMARMRRSMSVLTTYYCSTRMMREYLADAYLPGTEALRQRLAGNAEQAKAMARWAHRVRRHWADLHLGAPKVTLEGEDWAFTAPIYLGEMAKEDVRVEIYADPVNDQPVELITLAPREPIAGAVNGYIYAGLASASRPPEDFTLRIRPAHAGVRIPTEIPLILWQR